MAKIFYLSPGMNHDRRFLTKLCEYGHDVLYAYLVDGSRTFPLPSVRELNLGYRAIHGSGAGVTLRRVVKKIPCFRAAWRAMRDFQPDLVHAGWFPTVGFWAALWNRHPLVISVFGSDILVRARDRLWVRHVGRFALRRADVILTDSEHVRNEVQRLIRDPHKRIVDFPRGVELDWFHPDESLRQSVRRAFGWEDRLVVLVARHMEKLYRPEDALEAMALLRKRVPAAKLVYCADGSLKSRLQARTAALGLGDDVDFMPPYPFDRIREMYCAADVYLKCTETEATGVSMLEAMACGLPIVSADIPSAREWVQPGVNGFLFPVGEVENLAAVLVRLLGDAGVRLRMGEKNLRLARERADMNRTFIHLRDVYASLLSRERPAVTGPAIAGAIS